MQPLSLFDNNRILLNLHYSSNKLLFGLVVNTRHTEPSLAASQLQEEDVAVQIAYTEQSGVDAYSQMADHAQKRKAAFDKNVLAKAPREVVFKAGWLA
jgi:hypothetical protein